MIALSAWLEPSFPFNEVGLTIDGHDSVQGDFMDISFHYHLFSITLTISFYFDYIFFFSNS